MKSRVAFAAAGAAVLGIGGYYYQRERAAEQARAAREATATQAWADMQQCLVGAKMRDVPSPAARVRQIELAGQDAWPSSCAQHVTTLYGALDANSPLREELRTRFACDQACATNDPAVQLVGLAALATEMKDVAPKVAAPAMVTDRFITKADLAQLAPEGARIRDRDYLATGRARYLFNSGKGLSYCELSPDAEAARQCGDLALQIIPTTAKLVPGAEQTIIVGGGASYDTSGAKVAIHRGKDQGFVLSHIDKRRYRVEHVVGGAVKHDKKMKMPDGASVPVLIDDMLFYVAPDKDDERMLYLRKLRVDGEELTSKRSLVGPAAATTGAPQMCADGDERVLLFGRSVKDWTLVFVSGDGVSAPVAVSDAQIAKTKKKDKPKPKPKPKVDKQSAARVKALQDAAKFGMNSLDLEGKPVEIDSLWGREYRPKKPESKELDMWGDQLGAAERARRAPLPRFAFSCDGGAAHLTWRTPKEKDQLIHQVRCTGDGCKHAQVELGGLDVKTWWTAATVSDRVLIVWRDGDGLLRRRTAPLAQLGDTDDVLVMDSVENGGPATLDLEATYGRSAAIFVFRGNGFHALRFGADGVTSPL